MKISFARLWCQVSWLWFVPVSLLVIGVGLQTFLDPRYRKPDDFSWALFFTISFSTISLLAPLFKGWLLASLTALASLALFVVPLLNPETASTIGISSWILLVAYLIGDKILLKKIDEEALPRIDHLALAITTGIGSLMIIATIIGFTGLYYPLVAWLTLILPSLALLPAKIRQIPGSPFWKKFQRPFQFPDVRLPAWGLAVILICSIGAYLWSLAPAVRYDSLSYHIPVPLNNIQFHAISEMPESLQSYWAHYAEALYTLGMLIDSSVSLPAMLHFQAGLLSTLLVFVIGRKLGGALQGVIAAILFWSLPIVLVETGSAYVDLFPTAFISTAVYALWMWSDTRKDGWLLLTGFFSGMAVGVKLTAIFPVGLMGLFVLFKIVRPGVSIKSILKQVFLFALPALLCTAPWLVRDYLWTGNPIFPNYNHIFNSPKAFNIAQYEFRPSVTRSSRLVFFPRNLLFISKRFYHEMPGFAFGGMSIFSLPLLYPWVSAPQKRRAMIALASLAVFVILINQQIARNFRYILYIFPLLALLASENILLLRQAFQNRKAKIITFTISLVLCTAYLSVTQLAIAIRQYYISERFPYRYVLQLENSNQFLTRAVPLFQAFQFLETQEPVVKKIFSLGNEFRLYTTARVFGPLFSKEANDILHNSSDSEALAQNLRTSGYTHILFYQPEIDLRPKVYSAPILDYQFLYQHTQIIYIGNNIRIYRLNEEPDNFTDLPKNLLQNSSFETLNPQDRPVGWEIAGNLLVSSDGSQARTGKTAILITGPSITGAFQNVPIVAEEFYTVSYWAKPEEGQQLLQLFVMWLDKDFQIFDKSAEFAWLKPGWNNYQATFKPPPGAAYARMVVTTATSGTTWIDDLCLIPGGACP